MLDRIARLAEIRRQRQLGSKDEPIKGTGSIEENIDNHQTPLSSNSKEVDDLKRDNSPPVEAGKNEGGEHVSINQDLKRDIASYTSAAERATERAILNILRGLE